MASEQQRSGSSLALANLYELLGFYDRSASRTRVCYQALKLLTIVSAAAIPILTTAGADSTAVAPVGGGIVVIEGTQQLFRFHERYVGYRVAWNSLDRERRLFESRAGLYTGSAAERVLADRIEQVVEMETTKWASEAAKAGPSKATT